MFNLPQKQMKTIQVWVCVLLTVLALIMSFMPIIKLKTVENADQINEMMEDIGIDVEIPEKVNISAVGLFKSVKMIFDIVSLAADKDADEDKVEALEEKLTSKDGQNTVMTALAIATTVAGGSDDEEDSSSDDFITIIFNVLIVFMAIFGVLGMTVALPIIMIIKTIRTLVAALTNLQTPEEAVSKVGGLLLTSFSLILTLMVFQTLIPGMSYGSGLIGIFVVTIIAAVLNTAASRLHKYSKEEVTYLNVAQGVSVVGVIGFLVFFFNMIKANVFGSFLNGPFAKYLVDVGNKQYLIKNLKLDEQVNNAYVIDAVAILATWVLLVMTISYFVSSISRLSCTQKKSDCSIVGAIIALIVAIIPKVIAGAKHGYDDVASTASEGDFSFLVLNSDEEAALALVLVGAILMLVAEVALIVLKKVLCKDLTKDQMKSIISGSFVDAAPVAEVAEEAAEEVVAEEAPVAEETETK